MEQESTFKKELQNLINCHSLENGSDTPDLILAEYLAGCLEVFDRAVSRREKWYGREKPMTYSVTQKANIED